MKIFCDLSLWPETEKLLRDGAAPHEVLLARVPVASVLAKAEPDPAFAEAEIALGQPTVEMIEESPRLRWVQLTSAGYTRYDTPAFRAHAQARGLVVTNSSSVYAEPCAEHILSFLLGQARALPPALGAPAAANGSDVHFDLRVACAPLRRRSVLILGYGTIAEHLIRLLAPFEMKITAYRRTPRGDEGIPMVTLAGLPAALAAADHVIDILPENADSRHFMEATRFAAMKPGAIFYNIGRGATVDQAALNAALRSRRLGAAWLDVTDPEPLPDEHPLLSAPNCYITPHIAGGHGDEYLSLVHHFVDNLPRFVAGAPLIDRIF